VADLLEEMIAAATKAETPLADLLRQCMVLAHRLELDEFKEWVKHELNGYKRIEDLPDYRVRPASAYGSFWNGATFYRKHPISINMVPDEYQHLFRNFEMPESIGAIEQTMIPKGDPSPLMGRWTSTQVKVIGPQLKGIHDKYQLQDAWIEVSASFPYEILEAVRNRVIEFVLGVQQVFGTIDKIEEDTVKQSSDKIQHVYNITIKGDNKGTVAGIQQDVTNTIINIESGDTASLFSYLEGLGIGAKDLQELEAAIEEDWAAPDSDPKSLGKRVKGWFGNLSTNVASGAITQVALDALPGIFNALQQVLL